MNHFIGVTRRGEYPTNSCFPVSVLLGANVSAVKHSNWTVSF